MPLYLSHEMMFRLILPYLDYFEVLFTTSGFSRYCNCNVLLPSLHGTTVISVPVLVLLLIWDEILFELQWVLLYTLMLIMF